MLQALISDRGDRTGRSSYEMKDLQQRGGLKDTGN